MTRLEYLRRNRRLSQQKLGEAVLYSRFVIARLERDKPKAELVGIRLKKALESYFGESFEELMKDA